MDWTFSTFLIPMIAGMCGDGDGRGPLINLPPIVVVEPHGGDIWWRPYKIFMMLASGVGAVVVTRLLGQNVSETGFFAVVLTSYGSGFVTSNLIRGIGDMFRKP